MTNRFKLHNALIDIYDFALNSEAEFQVVLFAVFVSSLKFI